MVSFNCQPQYRPLNANTSSEMSNMNGNDPNRLLNETRAIDRAIDQLEQDLERLKLMHRRAEDDSGSQVQPEVNRLSSEIMESYQGLVARIRRLKQDPESGNPRNAPQVGKVDRRIKTMINKFQQADSDHRKKLNERSAREYRIVRPDASDAEVREAIEDSGNQQIFSQAVRIGTSCHNRFRANTNFPAHQLRPPRTSPEYFQQRATTTPGYSED